MHFLKLDMLRCVVVCIGSIGCSRLVQPMKKVNLDRGDYKVAMAVTERQIAADAARNSGTSMAMRNLIMI